MEASARRVSEVCLSVSGSDIDWYMYVLPRSGRSIFVSAWALNYLACAAADTSQLATEEARLLAQTA